MKMNTLILLLYWLMAACSKGSDPATDPSTPSVDNTPVQYGTPFAQVPDAKDAVIYQVNMRAFSSPGNFKGVQARLDSIKALGVNVLYLMPVYPVGVVNSVNSPYCVKDYFSVAAEFGTLDDLRTLVDEAHKRSMAVIFDWVANHTSWDHPWIVNKTWYQQDAGGNIISPLNTGWKDVAALNFKNADMRMAMIKAMKSWIYTTNIDGYRCDAADFIPYDFWKQAIDTLRNIGTHKLLLLAEGTRVDHFTAGFQMKYGMGFYYTMKDRVFRDHGSVKALDSVNAVEYLNATASSQVVRYTSNHDVDLFDGPPADLFGGEQGALAAFIVASYMKGAPMFYNGQEISYPVKIDYFNNSTPISWAPKPGVTSIYKKIIGLRNTSNALKTGTLTSYSSDDVCVFTRIAGAEIVLVIANLRNAAAGYTLPAALANTTWKSATDDSAVQLNTQLVLEPYRYMVLIKN